MAAFGRILPTPFSSDNFATSSGDITIKDGGTSGTSIAVFDTPKGAAANAGENVVGYIQIPGDGLHCKTSGYATLAGVAKVAVFYG